MDGELKDVKQKDELVKQREIIPAEQAGLDDSEEMNDARNDPGIDYTSDPIAAGDHDNDGEDDADAHHDNDANGKGKDSMQSSQINNGADKVQELSVQDRKIKEKLELENATELLREALRWNEFSPNDGGIGIR